MSDGLAGNGANVVSRAGSRTVTGWDSHHHKHTNVLTQVQSKQSTHSETQIDPVAVRFGRLTVN